MGEIGALVLLVRGRRETRMRICRIFLLIFAFAALQFRSEPVVADEFILIQTGTTLRDSGFFEAVLPDFTEATGIEVRVVAVGTGQAIRNAQRGDGDLLFTHSQVDEEKFVAMGYGLERRNVMFNDFIVVGPAADPAGVRGFRNVVDSFRRIANSGSPFASRGDDSGTHKAELRYWAEAGIDVDRDAAEWYRSLGAGMGATLNAGIAMQAYLLTDHATWLAFGRKRGHRIQIEGDPRLHNQYGVVLVSPHEGRASRLEDARTFFDWIVSDVAQSSIACFRIAGQQAYFPNAEGANHECDR